MTETQAGGTHIWRQRVPDGYPEQVTSGPNEETGIAPAPDGKSFITSVGMHDDMVWIHDQKGDRQIATEGDALEATFSFDGKKLYYLYSTSQKSPYPAPTVFNGSYELWAMEILTGKSERVLPGYFMESYSVSRDGRQVTFAASDQNNRPHVWVAATDHRSSPRQIVSNASEDTPSFLPDGDLVFRANEGGINFLYRMHADGSDRHKIVPARVLDLTVTSPDGKWAIVSADGPDQEHSSAWYAYPVDGGKPILLCLTICTMNWDIHGDYLYVSLFAREDQGTYALPVHRNSGLPDLPAKGLLDFDQLKHVKGAVFIPHLVDSALSTSLYAYTRQTIRRNLYRIPLP